MAVGETHKSGFGGGDSTHTQPRGAVMVDRRREENNNDEGNSREGLPPPLFCNGTAYVAVLCAQARPIGSGRDITGPSSSLPSHTHERSFVASKDGVGD